MINQSAWNDLSSGEVVISLYVNDTLGNVKKVSVTVIKKTSIPPSISYGLHFILFSISGIVYLISRIIKKKSSILLWRRSWYFFETVDVFIM